MEAIVKEGARKGRGFSLAELKEVGLVPRVARKHGIPTDAWRTTKYDENVKRLKEVASSIKEALKSGRKKAEEPKPQITEQKAKPAAKKKATGKKQKKKKPQKQKSSKRRAKK